MCVLGFFYFELPASVCTKPLFRWVEYQYFRMGPPYAVPSVFLFTFVFFFSFLVILFSLFPCPFDVLFSLCQFCDILAIVIPFLDLVWSF